MFDATKVLFIPAWSSYIKRFCSGVRAPSRLLVNTGQSIPQKAAQFRMNCCSVRSLCALPQAQQSPYVLSKHVRAVQNTYVLSRAQNHKTSFSYWMNPALNLPPAAWKPANRMWEASCRRHVIGGGRALRHGRPPARHGRDDPVTRRPALPTPDRRRQRLRRGDLPPLPQRGGRNGPPLHVPAQLCPRQRAPACYVPDIMSCPRHDVAPNYTKLHRRLMCVRPYGEVAFPRKATARVRVTFQIGDRSGPFNCFNNKTFRTLSTRTQGTHYLDDP